MQNTFNTKFVKVTTSDFKHNDFNLKTAIWENEQVYKKTLQSCVNLSGPLPIVLAEFESLIKEGYSFNDKIPCSSIGSTSFYLRKPESIQKEDLALIKAEVEKQYEQAVFMNWEAHKARLIDEALQAEKNKALEAELTKQQKLRERIIKEVEAQLEG